ncbi:MAG: imidazolonepropionase [Francisellaceae bacterium]
MIELIIHRATVITFNRQEAILTNASIHIDKECIIDIIDNDPCHYSENDAKTVIDLGGRLLSPGLIDCHTHVIHAGSRADEFALRLTGADYKTIAKAGGGILSTVNATREASFDELLAISSTRVTQMLRYGTTTLEVKSGYGLDTDNETKMLKVAKAIEQRLPVSILSTFLGAHALPPEFSDNKDGYIDYIINDMLPRIAKEKLADFVDGFCESIAFSTAQIQRVFHKAQELGFKLKLHAEQLSDQKGAVMAAEYGAVSVDHLEYLKPEDSAVLKENNTVAVLLPGAFYFLKEKQLPPTKALINSGVDIAIATDMNPGTSPFLSLPLMMNMACVFFGLTPYQAFKGVTVNAAKALAMADKIGSIEIGKEADLVLWSCHNYNDIVCNPTINFVDTIIKKGQLLWQLDSR